MNINSSGFFFLSEGLSGFIISGAVFECFYIEIDQSMLKLHIRSGEGGGGWLFFKKPGDRNGKL